MGRMNLIRAISFAILRVPYRVRKCCIFNQGFTDGYTSARPKPKVPRLSLLKLFNGNVSHHEYV